jgi:ankyrin repeat protein
VSDQHQLVIAVTGKTGDRDIESSIIFLTSGSVATMSDTEVEETALSLACRAGDIEKVTQLLTSGSDLEARSGVSSQLVHLVLFHLLLQSGWTPLHDASSRGHVKVVNLLLDSGADIESKDNVSLYFH